MAARQGNGQGNAGEPTVSYEHGTFQHALFELSELRTNQTYHEWIRKGIDEIVTPDGEVVGGYKVEEYSLDNMRNGEAIVKLYAATSLWNTACHANMGLTSIVFN